MCCRVICIPSTVYFQDKIARIEAGEKVAKDVLAIAEDVLKSARQFLDDARIAYEVSHNSSMCGCFYLI